jgi:murein DD-endopeptidase MepM/ murein hydrolase activator NlpD
MKKFFAFMMLMIGVAVIDARSQEKGLFSKFPKIKTNTKTEPKNPSPKKPAKDEFEDYEKETTKIRVANQFEPVAEQNPIVHEDTTTIAEGQTTVVEQIDSIQVGDDWVHAASYYVIWDSKTIDPYNLDPREFEETIQIQLVDKNNGFDWHLPLNRTVVTSQFGPRWGRNHEGMDLDATTGEPVYSTFDGIVRVISFNGNGYGKFVLVRHYNGLETLYGHLSKWECEVGQMVKAGDVIGLAGSTGRSTGDHLHFENRYEGNPFSPAWLWDFPHEALLTETFLLTPKVWDHFRGGTAYQGEFDISKSQLKKTIMHRVRRGETITVIANRYGLTVEELLEMNRLEPDSALRPGQQLRIK